MKRSIIFAAVAATIAAAPASAQPVAADLLPPYEVATIIASMGMRPVERPVWRAGRYVVSAVDRYGREVRVVLDARDGQVIAVRPLVREYGYDPRYAAPPPPGYPRPAPYDPRYADPRYGAPPPGAIPNSPPADDDEFFDNERQQGSVTPPRAPARSAPRRDDPVTTGSVTRNAVPERKPAVSRDVAARDVTPMPRPRPALARANDPTSGSATAPAAPNSKPDQSKAGDKKADEKKRDDKASSEQKAAAQPDARAAKAEAAKPDAPKPDAKKDVRVIDMSKPKPAAKPEDKPGDVIRF